MNGPKLRDPEERFVSLAEKRVNSAIKALRQVGNLANRKNYSYKDEHARKIVKALKDEMRKIEFAFKEGKDINDNFSLK